MDKTARTTQSTSSRSDRHKYTGLLEFIAACPSIGPVSRFRTAIYGKLLGGCGSDFQTESGVIFEFPERVSVGSRVFINRGTVVTARAPVSIGDDVLIGPYVIINSGNHVFGDVGLPINMQGHDEAPISIGDNVWLGAHVCVLPGVSIGKGCVIGAGAIVVRDVPDYTLAVGVPAKAIRSFRGDADV